MHELRDYQNSAIEGLRGGFRMGRKRQILCAPCGSGKTEMAMFFVRAAAEKGKRVAFVCDRLALVEQTSQRFQDAGIEHGVLQGGNSFGRSLPVQVCSAQTIEKRGLWPGLDLLVVDECHVQRKATLEFAKNWGGMVIGLTATPFTEGLAETYQRVVNACTTSRLLADGWLAPIKVYAAKEIDMRGAERKPGGEWSDRAVEKRGSRIVGDIVSTWEEKTKLHFGGPVKTIAFSATVEHGAELCRAFNTAGHNFQQISYLDRDDDKRRALIEDFREGRITGLVSVEALARGFDVPEILCGISARPYRKSFSAHIQQMGRVMRTAAAKNFALWLDHTGNYLGFFSEMEEFFGEGCAELSTDKTDKSRTRKELDRRPDRGCRRCGFVMEPETTACPSCGMERRQGRGRSILTVAGRSEEVEGVDHHRGAWKDDVDWVWTQICRVAAARHWSDLEHSKRFAWAQYKALYGSYPARTRAFIPDREPADIRVERAIDYRIRKWLRGRAA